jgi:polyhydroxyalkanoate synthesis regulator phasin
MDEPGNPLREAAERLAVAGRDAFEELSQRWRGDAKRVGERSSTTFQDVLREVGMVSRREYEELELRVAQLEHRLRLLEGPRAAPDPPRTDEGA